LAIRERAILTTSIERHGLAAWPGFEQRRMGGWTLTFGGGHTKRANSATLLESDGGAPTDSISAIEQAYREQGLPPIFRINPLALDSGMDDRLNALNYLGFDETCVQVLTTSQPQTELVQSVAFSSGRDEAWRRGLAAAQSLSEAQAIAANRMLDRITGHTIYAMARHEGAPAAWGMGVVADGMIGLFNIVTLPEYRGRGLGGNLVRSLLAAGARQGAEIAYLQVGAENHQAQSLYAGFGFRDHYRYHYRRAP
jgi:ribosomal protein S18 acetylase RimI-like enzyme